MLNGVDHVIHVPARPRQLLSIEVDVLFLPFSPSTVSTILFDSFSLSEWYQGASIGPPKWDNYPKWFPFPCFSKTRRAITEDAHCPDEAESWAARLIQVIRSSCQQLCGWWLTSWESKKSLIGAKLEYTLLLLGRHWMHTAGMKGDCKEGIYTLRIDNGKTVQVDWSSFQWLYR